MCNRHALAAQECHERKTLGYIEAPPLLLLLLLLLLLVLPSHLNQFVPVQHLGPQCHHCRTALQLALRSQQAEDADQLAAGDAGHLRQQKECSKRAFP
jgi:hypothetical protein